MADRKRLFLKWILPLLLVGAVWLSHPLWMTALGNYLVRADEPAPADIALVLAGDYSGYRIVEGAELVRQGFTGSVLNFIFPQSHSSAAGKNHVLINPY